jgi:hypothetical protein
LSAKRIFRCPDIFWDRPRPAVDKGCRTTER